MIVEKKFPHTFFSCSRYSTQLDRTNCNKLTYVGFTKESCKWWILTSGNDTNIFWVTTYVTRFGDLWKFLETNLIAKLAQIFCDCFGYLKKHDVLSRNCCEQSLGNFWRKSGYFILEHLVTVVTTICLGRRRFKPLAFVLQLKDFMLETRILLPCVRVHEHWHGAL